MDGAKYATEDLKKFASDCFVAAGVPAKDADWTADTLVLADLSGKSTHGISRLSAYIGGIDKGKINPRPNISVQITGAATATVDGDDGLGPVVARAAMQTAIERAKEAGVGAVTVRRGNHIGVLARYANMAADEGFIGLVLTNAQPAIPPWGGRRAYFGTNPIAMSAGRGDEQISVDLATSVTARGNVIMASKDGSEIPEGWAIDEAGEPTTDAAAALKGALLPMAGPKGYSLALLVEILSGVLSGAAIGDEVGSIYDDAPDAPNTGIFVLVLNPGFFLGESGSFATRLSHMEQAIHANPLAKGVSAVYLPGERQRAEICKREAQGMALPETTKNELQALANRFSLNLPKEFA